jgi:hypothetical protein
MKVALTCIAKDEDYYITEWMDYHLYLGFDKIFVYQNDWKLNIDSPFIEKIQFDGLGRQEESYNNFISNYSDEFDWVAFMDVDEFLVLKVHDNIKEFLHEYKDFNGVAINWYLFGDNNHSTLTGDYSVLKRFTKRAKKIDNHVKCIVKPKAISKYRIHCPNDDSVVDTDKRMVLGPFNYNGNDNIAQINHYFTKTKPEWDKKLLRGRAPLDESGNKLMRNESDFNHHNMNEVEDLHALNFFIKKSTIF